MGGMSCMGHLCRLWYLSQDRAMLEWGAVWLIVSVNSRMAGVEPEEISITENYLVPPSSLGAMEDDHPSLVPPSQGYQQNIIVLSILLSVALITNLPAFPVILFRRTRWYLQHMQHCTNHWGLYRFGNGQFACLIFCLTVCDLVCVISGLVGGLILEVGDMSWVGTSQGCAAYYFISSW